MITIQDVHSNIGSTKSDKNNKLVEKFRLFFVALKKYKGKNIKKWKFSKLVIFFKWKLLEKKF